MQEFLDITGPMIAAVVVGAVVIVAVLAMTVSRMRLWASGRARNRAIAESGSQAVLELRATAGDLADAVAAVITELEGHPATYATFPEDVRVLLDRAYGRHDSITSKGPLS
jgi:hypothetical protein